MARISGVELQENWKVDYALTRIKGVGWTLSKKMIAELKLDPAKRIKDLTPEEISKISNKMDEIPNEGDLARQVRANIQRLITIGSYRGARHSHSLPTRGQRTRTNARTKRGKKKTIGAFKKDILSAQKVATNQKETKK